MRKRILVVAAAVAALVAASIAAAAVISPGHLNGWTPVAETCGGTLTGAQGFENGPGNPPGGNGSYFFQVGSNGDTYRTLRYGGLGGVDLDDLTALDYWTYVVNAPGSQAVYIDLYVDSDGNGTKDDTLTFEPVYNGTVTPGTWQHWNALTGLWWSDTMGGPPPLFTLASYISSHPNAQIVNNGSGGFLLSSGCGGAAWTNFDGNVDLVRIGVNGANRTFDFEATPPAQAGGGKVTICHKGHTIRVSKNAVPAHMRHGDTTGPC